MIEKEKAISNSIIFSNNEHEVIELLSYDKKFGLALIHILDRNLQPYVVVHGLDVCKGEWNAGHYFEKENEAHDYYREEISSYDKERYRHTIEYLIKEEFDAIGKELDSEKISELFDYVVMESDEGNILNANIFADMEEYLEKEEIEEEEM